MKIYTVSEFRTELNELFGQVTVAIEGEVSEFKISRERFVWFSLVDEEAVLPCFMLTFQLRQPLEDGMKVRVVGSPTMFKSGRMVFRPRQIELVGDGTLQRAFSLLKAKLDKEGLFAAERKRPLPHFPHCMGLITSKDAAAYTDVLRILNNRWAGLEIYFINVAVQGARAVGNIVAAIEQINVEVLNLDCIILTRGGGSLDDLQAFNNEEVVRAMFASRVPVVCGVGHERDVTLADMVADVRAATPSNAAEIAVPHKHDVLNEINHMLAWCGQQVSARVQDYREQITGMMQVLEQQARLSITEYNTLQQRLWRELEQFTANVQLKKAQLANHLQLLHSYHPQHVLRRGYTMTTNEHGRILQSAKQVKPDQQLCTIFYNGQIISRVREK